MSLNGVPQLLKGLNIAFTGMFQPYSQLNLINMCEKLGAKNVNQVSKTTSVLIQGTHIVGFYGNPYWDREMNSTNKSKAAIQKGVRIVSNDEIDEYFIEKTGKTVEELMNIVKNASSSLQKSNQNVQSENIPKSQFVQKPQSQIEKNNKMEVRNTQQSIKIPHSNSDQQEFKESVIKALHLAGFKDTLQICSYKEFIEIIATCYYNGELTFDGIIEYLEDIFYSDTPKKRYIAEIIQMIKKDFHKENGQEQRSLRDARTDQNILKQSQTSSSCVEKYFEIKGLQSKILSSFEVLKKDCDKTKGVCYESFNDIFDSIKEIQNSKDVNTIQQTVNQLKKDVERCFFIYKKLSKDLRNYERELRPLIQEQHEISDTESVCSFLSRNIKERPSKKERLALKKQQKKMEKHQIQVPQQKNQSKVDINFTDKNQCDENPNEPDDKGFAHLPALLYLRRNFSEEQIPERYKKLPSKQSMNKGGKGSNRYSLTIKGKADFNMREFLRYDWGDLQRLVINQCRLVSQDWKLLCNNSQLLFKNLKILGLGSNKIEEVRKEEIMRFPQLEGLNLGKNPLHANPLSKQSLQDLRRWQRESKFDGKIIFYNKQQK